MRIREASSHSQSKDPYPLNRARKAFSPRNLTQTTRFGKQSTKKHTQSEW